MVRERLCGLGAGMGAWPLRFLHRMGTSTLSTGYRYLSGKAYGHRGVNIALTQRRKLRAAKRLCLRSRLQPLATVRIARATWRL
jgi:hypothetical protein